MATGFSRTSLTESIQYHYDILCDICDESHVASWSCNTCGQNLCETCKRNHQKISFTKNHPILPLLDRHESEGGHGILCTHHQEPILFFCDCQEETCRKCQSEAHRGHKAQDIAVHAKRIRNEIKKEFESKKRSIVDAREKVRSLQDEKQEFDNQSETDIERVKKTLGDLRKYFREQAKNLIKDIESKLEKSEDDFKNESSSAGRELDEAEIEMNELLAAYRRQPDAGLGKYWKENLQPKIQNVKIDVNISFDRIVFRESQFDKLIKNIKSDVEKLKTCFKENVYEQTLYKRKSWSTETDVAKALKQSFTLEGGVTIYSLSVVHTEQIQSVWIGLCRKETFRVELFSANGECLRHKSINFPPLYLLSLQQNAKKDTSPQADDVLITSGVQSSFIRSLKTDGHLADFKDVTPFFPFGMCCSSDGHVFVCLQKSEFAGKVIQLTMTGEVVKEFFLHNCFTPTRIMNTPSGVIVKNDCSLINLKGNTFVKLNTDDCVSSVCCDSQGNIFGAGIDKDSNEPCIKKVHKKSKVTFPLPFVCTCFVADIACDIHNNVLWVASSDGNIQAVGTDFFMREK